MIVFPVSAFILQISDFGLLSVFGDSAFGFLPYDYC
jgi:hypothetical protein